MRFSIAITLCSVLSTAAALPSFVLTGDSTVTNDAGWGGAFCSQTLISGVTCQNFARGGTTTASFRSGGDWDRALAAARAATKPVYVTIQFGHNDQKLTNFEATYQNNLVRMASDVRSIPGATPVFVTSLSRRNYSGGKIVDLLEPWAARMRTAANQSGSPYVELLQTSITYLNKIGNAAADKLDYAVGDNTHLNAPGARVFARMVVDLIKGKNIVSPNPFNTDATLSTQIKNGVPSY